MKKYLLVIVVFLLEMRVYANPVLPPMVNISELEFRENNKWFLEVELLHFDKWTPPDGFLVVISGDTSIPFWFDYYNKIITIDISSLSLSINLLGDSIKILPIYYDYDDQYYIRTFDGVNELVFGNCEGAVIQAPKMGQSIALHGFSSYDYFYVIDNSPSLGFANDNDGIFATMRGVVYSMELLPVANRKFQLMGIDFETDANGNYSTLIHARQSHFTSINYYPNAYRWPIPIDDIIFEIYPDSIIEQDIYVLDTLKTSITDIEKKENFPIRFFPNPVSSGKLHYEIDLPILSGNMSLSIFSTDGKLVKSHKITNSIGEIEMAQTAGIYQIVLKMDNRVISTKSIMVE